MSAASPSRGRLGGLGAIFFLGTLGAIALYVQRQTIPSERDVVRKSVSVLTEEPAPETPRALPWEDRLDLNATSLLPISAPEPKDPQKPGSKPTPEALPTPGEAPPDPATGRYVQDLSDGHRILLTLDPVLQQSALTIFRNREVPYGAAVMVDLRDNSVLTLAGHSSMDPEVDPLEVVATAWAPAASTFKLVTATGLLQAQKATPGTRVCFNGGLHGINDAQLRDDRSRDKQCSTLSSAVAHSHNLVIGKLALRHLEQDDLVSIATTLKFESDIPFEFPVERSPVHVPKDPVDRAKVAAGFWNADMSPLHGALLASIFARGGTYQPPHIIAQVRAPDGIDLTPETPAPTRVIDKKVAQQVAEMMLATTMEGTARGSFRDGQGNPYIPEAKVAGKTGSLTGRREPYLNYNWFIGFAPADQPEVAFAVLLANEPKWRIKAHYVGRRLIQLYLQRREEITRARRTRLTDTGVEVPTETPTTKVLAAPASDPVPKSAPVDHLPPVPGPLPKPTDGA